MQSDGVGDPRRGTLTNAHTQTHPPHSPIQDGVGTAELGGADDVERAIKRLDDTNFRSHTGMCVRAGVLGRGGGRRER